MTNLKDKLSASVRQAKAAQTPAAKAAQTPAAKATATKSAPAKRAARKPAAKRASKLVAHESTGRDLVVKDPVSPKVTVSNSPITEAQIAAEKVRIAAGGIPESSNQLFPQRVWPD